MALADVLTAVRQLILDPIDLPPDFEDRRAVYGSRFPKLRPDEIEDLAKMEPKRIRTYTDSIFSGQTNVLEDKFEITFKLLETRYSAKGEKFYPFDFVRAVHAARPWKDTTTEGLGKNLVDYLKTDRPDMLKLVPEAADSAEMELASFLVIRAQNDIVSAKDSLAREVLQALPVGELLETEFTIPSYVEFRRFDYDVLALRRYYYSNEKTVPETVLDKAAIQAAVGRDIEFYIRWRGLDADIYDLLSSQPRSTPIALEQLAAAVSDSQPAGVEEVEIFRSFFTLTADLIACGIIVVR